MSWVLALVGFAFLVIAHEFGHFAVAKMTGMRVERFFLFFPPKIFSVRKGETEYGVGAIPAGGFVKITGMNPDEELPPEIAARGYYNQPVWKRIVTIAAGPAMNVVIAFVILLGLSFGATQAVGSGLEVGSVQEGSPASKQMRVGDRIISIDGVRARRVGFEKRASLLRDQISTHRCRGQQVDGCAAAEPVRVVVIRNGERRQLEMIPRYEASERRPLLGFAFQPSQVEATNPTPGEAAGTSLDFMWEVTTGTVGVLSRLFDPAQREQISGIVGSYETTRQAIEFDTRTALTVIAVISLSLAIVNLFPFLPLDGGHIFWSVVEKVRGRRPSYRVMERAGAVGFVLIIMLFLIGLSNDIERLNGEGFGLR